MKKIAPIIITICFLFFYSSRASAQCNPQKCNCGDDKCAETCLTCQGKGCVICESCGGKGCTTCDVCAGKGYTELGGVKKNCFSCDGRGWRGCQTCGGLREAVGTGRHLCYSCMGMGCICPK